MRPLLTLACLAVVSAGTLAGCAAPGARADGRLSVVAGESPWGAIAAAVGGSRVAVTSLIAAPGSDPHEFVASAPAAAAVATADVVVENGLGYDAFLDHLLATGATHERKVVNAASVLKVAGTDANPHLFYAVDRVGEVANAIAQTYEELDPTHRSTYQANLLAFNDSMVQLLSAVDAIRATHGGEPVAQTERLAGYLLDAAGLTTIGPTGFTRAIEEGREPTAADRRAFEDLLGGHRLAALIVRTGPQNAAVSSAVQLATTNGVGVVAFSELVMPQGMGYVPWMRAQVTNLGTTIRSTS